ncbi:NitT/TauT family transport system permease protein [Rhodoblastus acidophilus]|uniref:ABC transporter permease n=1 Tax=Rhodoblastus acidophilus TaxID=1074 RepID=UPI002224F59B|nr:ABC transporter permease subunit [Rhodoblastus acidophilus]MCW2285433.1 NitT/TauT family transport system permease protein [Rhodoblastus acidophilus]MCW2334318.1 NitT/TauT family transport system permease protein [Rhodoblastus acidophilus]
MKIAKNLGVWLIGFGLVGGYWLLTDGLHVLDPFLFAGPSRISPAFMKSLGKLGEGFVSSLALLAPAYALAVMLGIGFGVLIGLAAPLRRIVTPYINAFSAVPVTLLTPFAIHIFSSFYTASVFVIFLGAFWPILGSTIAGVTTIDRRYLESAATLEIGGVEKMFRVVLPAAAPTILAGCSIALKFAFILLTVAEMFGTTSGMGYFVQYYSDFAKFDFVIAGFLFMAAILMAVMALFETFRRRMVAWTLNG